MKKIIKLYESTSLKLITQPWWCRGMAVLGLLSFKSLAFADIPTPAPGDDPTQAGSGFFEVLKNIIGKEGAPVLIYGGTIFLVVAAVFEIYRGYKKSQESDDMGKFVMSLVTGTILLVLGISLFFFGQYIDEQWVNAA